MPTIKQNKAFEIIEKIFGEETIYGLKEFEGIEFDDVLYISEEEKGRYYIKDIKSGNKKFVYDEEKLTSKPEEIVRQLWLHKLHKDYKYPLDRIDTEKSIHFGREIHAKAADIIVYKPDKIT
ncbi:MAG: type I restriction enzyme HsdR N-terminal domain-containing protein, partial [Patescibacteria group bacterium]|nr:type I restriction enzyme HsdR N-terminal domain-containing protein [Patescibacteria group bacterium]